jgi:hypothetical protein
MAITVVDDRCRQRGDANGTVGNLAYTGRAPSTEAHGEAEQTTEMCSEKQWSDERRIVRAVVPGMGDGSSERSTSFSTSGSSLHCRDGPARQK